MDDSAIARRLLRALLAESPEVVLVGEANSAEDALLSIADSRPDLVVMDWSMPGMSGIQATAELHRAWPDLRVVGFTSTDDPEVLDAFIDAGAAAVFAKEHALALRDYLVAAAAAT